MKRLFQLLLAACLAGTITSAGAAPPKRAELPPDPAWLFHIDCDALRQTYLGRYILYQLNKPEVYSNMITFQSVFNFDVRTQLHGLTLYSDGPTARENVVILYADFTRDRLIETLKQNQGAKVSIDNGHQIYNWPDQRDAGGAGGLRNYADIQNNRMVASKSKAKLLSALAVIDGAAPNLAASRALPEMAPAGDTTFIQATARNLEFLGSIPGAALLKMSKRVKFRASEANEQCTAVLTMEAGDEITARQMSIVAQGLTALLSLQRDNPKAAHLAGAIAIKQDGATVTATLVVPSSELIAVLKASTAKSPGQ